MRLLGDDEDEEVQLGANGTELAFGPWDIELIGEDFVESFAFSVVRVRFDEPGLYEFQLWLDPFPSPVGRERILLRGQIHDDN